MKEKHPGFRKRDGMNDLEFPGTFSLSRYFRVSTLKGRKGIKYFRHWNHVAMTKTVMAGETPVEFIVSSTVISSLPSG